MKICRPGMSLWLRLLVSLFAALAGCFPFSGALAADWPEVQALSQTIHAADLQGDFDHAARAAEQCVAITASTKPSIGGVPTNYYCKIYLSSALRSGRGLPRDEGRAFAVLKDLVATDQDGGVALSLAEAYLDGAGTPRDPIEAAAILWRVQHGAWSIYSDYWGMCKDCADLWRNEKTFSERIDRELTKEEKARANAVAALRFPDIVARVKHRDRQIAAAIATPITMLGGLLWLRQWRARRRRSTTVPT